MKLRFCNLSAEGEKEGQKWAKNFFHRLFFLSYPPRFFLQIFLILSFLGTLQGYEFFRVGYSFGNLSLQKGEIPSKNISGILFGIEKARFFDNLLFGGYLEGNVSPLDSVIDGGYYSLGLGAKVGYKFNDLLAYTKLGAEYMSLNHTSRNIEQKNIGGVALEIGGFYHIIEGFGLGLGIKTSVPSLYAGGAKVGLVGIMCYFGYAEF
ncbi:hypothetical protein [Helicobacter himalayensis]|uniref:hypothetical protein n=1 Tax=Helicobacter himalayensis TaxID=1591088 RepID=UPI003D6F0435